MEKPKINILGFENFFSKKKRGFFDLNLTLKEVVFIEKLQKLRVSFSNDDIG